MEKATPEYPRNLDPLAWIPDSSDRELEVHHEHHNRMYLDISNSKADDCQKMKGVNKTEPLNPTNSSIL